MNPKVQTFSNLPHSEKVSKLLLILELFEVSKNVFRDIYLLIKENGDELSDDFLVGVYEAVLDLIQDMSEQETKNKMKGFEKIQQDIKSLHKKEMQEKQAENQNLESILTTF